MMKEGTALANKEAMIEFEEIVSETEKAFKLQVEVDDHAGERHASFIWVPKSQVVIDGHTAYLPVWLASQKMDDFESRGLFLRVSNEKGEVLI